MSRTRLIIALSISVIFIGTASWFRFAPRAPLPTNIESVTGTTEQFIDDEVLLADFVSTSTPPATVSSTPLSQTDIISRQFFSDYIELSSQGQANAENFGILAERYAKDILKETVTSTEVAMDRILAIPDSEENLSLYGQSMSLIRNKYQGQIEAEYARNSATTNVSDPAFKKFMTAAGKLYQSAAKELLATQVPFSLAENHRNLINNYFASAENMVALSNVTANPIGAYTAISTQAKNAQEEADLLLNIQMTLLANGIIFERGI